VRVRVDVRLLGLTHPDWRGSDARRAHELGGTGRTTGKIVARVRVQLPQVSGLVSAGWLTPAQAAELSAKADRIPIT
jgi:hypothetical protein